MRLSLYLAASISALAAHQYSVKAVRIESMGPLQDPLSASPDFDQTLAQEDLDSNMILAQQNCSGGFRGSQSMAANCQSLNPAQAQAQGPLTSNLVSAANHQMTGQASSLQQQQHINHAVQQQVAEFNHRQQELMNRQRMLVDKRNEVKHEIQGSYNRLVNSKEANEARDEIDGAIVSNDYVMKMLHNDPRNHVTDTDAIANVVGRDKAQVINWVSQEETNEIMDTLISGAKQLEKKKIQRDSEVGDVIEKAKSEAEDATNNFYTAQAKLASSKKAYQKIKDQLNKTELEDYKFLRNKIEGIVGTRDAADEVMKEAIIQKMHADANSGIIIDVDGDGSSPLIQLNGEPRVKVSKANEFQSPRQSVSVDVFPGEVAKPQVTFVKHDNYELSKFGDPYTECHTCDPNPVPDPIVIPAPAPEIITIEKPVPYEVKQVEVIKVPEHIIPPMPKEAPQMPMCPECPTPVQHIVEVKKLIPPPPQQIEIEVKKPSPPPEKVFEIEIPKPAPCPEHEVEIEVQKPAPCPEHVVELEMTCPQNPDGTAPLCPACQQPGEPREPTECEKKAVAAKIAGAIEKPRDGGKTEIDLEFNKEIVQGEQETKTNEGCPCQKKVQKAFVPKVTDIRHTPPEYELEVSVEQNECGREMELELSVEKDCNGTPQVTLGSLKKVCSEDPTTKDDTVKKTDTDTEGETKIDDVKVKDDKDVKVKDIKVKDVKVDDDKEDEEDEDEDEDKDKEEEKDEDEEEEEEEEAKKDEATVKVDEKDAAKKDEDVVVKKDEDTVKKDDKDVVKKDEDVVVTDATKPESNVQTSTSIMAKYDSGSMAMSHQMRQFLAQSKAASDSTTQHDEGSLNVAQVDDSDDSFMSMFHRVFHKAH